MTKNGLIDEVSKRYRKLTRKKIEDLVDTVFDSIAEALTRDCRVEIRGFGNFTAKMRRAREGRNPRNGSKVVISRKRTPLFRMGKDLKNRVNSSLLEK